MIINQNLLFIKNQIKFKLWVVFICFFVNSYYGIANDTIRMITRCNGATSNGIVATLGAQFTVNYGDGTIKTFTGTGISQSLPHNYSYADRYEVTITGSEDCSFIVFDSDRADTMDLSSCPSIINYYTSGSTLRSLNTTNCTNLERITLSRNKLTVLDLKDNIALKDLVCSDNQLTHIDLVSTEIECIWCKNNHLQLSYLYAFSEMISDPWMKILGPQELVSQRIAVGDSIDFSDQKEFGGIATVFQVEKYGLQPEDYKIKDGIITFYKSGGYRIIMTNAAIVAYQGSNVVVAPINVIDFVPVTEIINVPEKAIVGIHTNLNGTVVPNNATYKSISWSVKDAGTTGVTIPTAV